MLGAGLALGISLELADADPLGEPEGAGDLLGDALGLSGSRGIGATVLGTGTKLLGLGVVVGLSVGDSVVEGGWGLMGAAVVGSGVGSGSGSKYPEGTKLGAWEGWHRFFGIALLLGTYLLPEYLYLLPGGGGS
jgi:hypothetical protein